MNFDYLSINNSIAQFKGTGKIIGGQSGINFIMTVIDGDLDGSGIDKIRMKIFNKNTGEIYYDNEPAVSEAANPSTAVGANSTITISATDIANSSSVLTRATSGQEVNDKPDPFMITAYPNPSGSNFTIRTNSSNKNDKISVQVIDVYGRVIETRRALTDQPFTFGEGYRAGTYFLRVIQDKNQRLIKLVKIADKL